jgi:hypothetical protein
MTLTTHPHIVSRSRMSRSYTSSPPSVFVACSGTASAFFGWSLDLDSSIGFCGYETGLSAIKCRRSVGSPLLESQPRTKCNPNKKQIRQTSSTPGSLLDYRTSGGQGSLLWQQKATHNWWQFRFGNRSCLRTVAWQKKITLLAVCARSSYRGAISGLYEPRSLQLLRKVVDHIFSSSRRSAHDLSLRWRRRHTLVPL